MVAAFADQMTIAEQSSVAKAQAFMQSRRIGLCAGIMCLPFLLAAPAAKPLHVLLVMAALLLPSTIALAASKFRPIAVAALTEALTAVLLSLGFMAAGLGLACSLALLALALIDYQTVVAKPTMPSRWMALAAVAFFAALWLLVSRVSGETTYAYGAASLALLRPFVQAFFTLRTNTVGVDVAAIALPDAHTLSAATLRHGLETALLLDRSGRVLTLGSNALDNLGNAAQELRGRGLFERLHLLDRPALLKACAEVKAHSPQNTIKLRLRLDAPHPDTRLVTFVDLDARIIPPDENSEHILVFLSKSRTVPSDHDARGSREIDVSDRYLAEISHYVRTPLNAVIGFADLLSTPATQPKEPGTIAEYGEIILEAGQTLLRITDTLVDMVRLKSGCYVLAPQPVDPIALVQAAEENLRNYFGEKHLSLTIESIDLENEWSADRQAAVAIVAGVAAAMMDVHASSTITVRISSTTSAIEFHFRTPSIRIVASTSDACLRDRLSARSGLVFEQAQALARYQDGVMVERQRADGGFEIDVALPLSPALGKTANAPVSLDRFRRVKDDHGQHRTETVIKKHA